MQKIVIKNFGPIRDAEIEIKKILLLIGEQASGKSTIAKLIYIFKSIRDDFFEEIYQGNSSHSSNILVLLAESVMGEFHDLLGSTKNLPEFEIKYYYNVEKEHYITVSLDSNKQVRASFSPKFFTNEQKDQLIDYHQSFVEIKKSNDIHEQLVIDNERKLMIQRLSSFINDSFSSYHNSPLYIIAGRNATVSYSGLFEKYLFSYAQQKIHDNKILGFDDSKKEQIIDESLMLEFIKRTEEIKSFFEKYGSFDDIIEMYQKDKKLYDSYLKLVNSIDYILKGKYQIDKFGEKLYLQDKGEEQYVYLKNSSSGQQESIRILQDIFLSIVQEQKVLRVIEEPEAHLYPEAQKQIIELLSLLANYKEENQVIITTHSPYVLTVFNNLLFAQRVIDTNKEVKDDVAQIIDSYCLLSSSDFSCYSLKSDEEYCTNILNKKTGLIDQNYLDDVSEQLNNDFNQLYSLHAKSMRRK